MEIEYFKYIEPKQSLTYADYADCDYYYAECIAD